MTLPTSRTRMSKPGKQYDPRLTAKARRLRRAQTDAERTLWNHLSGRQLVGAKFRRQQPIGRYIVDFVSQEDKLIIELDGGHHNEPAVQSLDGERSRWLESKGYRVLRFWNNDVGQNLDGVVYRIREALSG